MNKLLKFILYILTFALALIPIIFAVIVLKSSQGAFESSFTNEEPRQSSLRDGKVNAAKEPISILFLGIDDNEGRRKNGQSAEKSRTDAMIFSTFNPDKQQIRMLSIPRDTISYIPKVGYYDKITHAHAYGGPTAAMDAVEATLNVPVDYFVRVNMKAFEDAVDELGGIYFDVPYNLDEPNSDDSGRIKIKKGYQKLNGAQALAVARTRHQDSDLKRGQRQMELIQKLFAKAQQSDAIDKLDEVIKIVGKNAKHNLTFDEIKAIALQYLSQNVEFKREQLKGDDDTLGGVYYYNPDIKNIMAYANLLRSDLNLNELSDPSDFLNQRVIDFYGNLIPQMQIDERLLRKNQQDSTADESEATNENDTTTDSSDLQNDHTEPSEEVPFSDQQQVPQAPQTPQTPQNNEANVPQ